MTNGIVFFEEYFNYMDDMTPEQYCQFMTLIKELRFKGNDTRPEELTDKVVRLAWRAVRPSILKSTTNAKNYEERKNKKTQSNHANTVETVTNDCTLEKWVSSLEEDNYPCRDVKFERGWKEFFTIKEEARSYALAELNNKGIHLSKIGY